MRTDYQNVVVFFVNGHGDAIMTLPTLRALTHLFGDRMSLVCYPSSGRIHFHELGVRLHPVTMIKEGEDKDFDAKEVMAAIPECDLLICLNPWRCDSTWELLKGWEPHSLGFFEEFTEQIPLDYSKHTAHLSFDFVKHFDPSLRFEDFDGEPVLTAEAHEKANRVLAHIPEQAKILCVHTETMAQKMWRIDRFVTTMNRFLEAHPDVIILLLDHKNRGYESGPHKGRIVSCEGVALDVAYALISKAQLFLGVDSCMLHAADFFRVPALGLFGPTSADEFGCLIGPHQHVIAETMEDIEVDTVVSALESLWEEAQVRGMSQPVA